MPTGTVEAIQHSAHKANESGTRTSRASWMAPIGRGVPRAHLQVLRDRLTIDEATQLATQLPHLLRGVFYEASIPAVDEKIRDRGAFLARLADRANLSDTSQAPVAAAAATRVLRRHVRAGEIDDVLAQLPKEIREMEPRPGGAEGARVPESGRRRVPTVSAPPAQATIPPSRRTPLVSPSHHHGARGRLAAAWWSRTRA